MSARYVQHLDERRLRQCTKHRRQLESWQQRRTGYPVYTYQRRQPKRPSAIQEGLYAVLVVVAALVVLYA
jgi:hypothetical protein